jgi:hypothetical protein
LLLYSSHLPLGVPNGLVIHHASECEEGEAAFVEVVFFSEEFKEIHAATDPAEMPASK